MDDGPGGYERSYFHLKHKFDQLQSSHDRLLRLNQELEEKMLSLVQRFDAEKACLVCRADATVARVGALVDENSRLLQANVSSCHSFLWPFLRDCDLLLLSLCDHCESIFVFLIGAVQGGCSNRNSAAAVQAGQLFRTEAGECELPHFMSCK